MTRDPRTKVVPRSRLQARLAALRRQGKTIVFTNGCFDILHWGHVNYLAVAKRDDSRALVVGLNSDLSVRALHKGPGRPIVPQAQRAAVLAGLESVDLVVMFGEPTPERLIRAVRPDVLVKGADWKGKPVAGAESVLSRGGRVEFARYLKGLSTTDIVGKVARLCRAR